MSRPSEGGDDAPLSAWRTHANKYFHTRGGTGGRPLGLRPLWIIRLSPGQWPEGLEDEEGRDDIRERTGDGTRRRQHALRGTYGQSGSKQTYIHRPPRPCRAISDFREISDRTSRRAGGPPPNRAGGNMVCDGASGEGIARLEKGCWLATGELRGVNKSPVPHANFWY